MTATRTCRRAPLSAAMSSAFASCPALYCQPPIENHSGSARFLPSMLRACSWSCSPFAHDGKCVFVDTALLYCGDCVHIKILFFSQDELLYDLGGDNFDHEPKATTGKKVGSYLDL